MMQKAILKRRILVTLMTTIMLLNFFAIIPATAQITTPVGYIRLPENLLDQQKAKDLNY